MTDGTRPPFPGSRMERRRAEKAAQAAAAKEASEADGRGPETPEAPTTESTPAEVPTDGGDNPPATASTDSSDIENRADSGVPVAEPAETKPNEEAATEAVDDQSALPADHAGIPGSRLAARKKSSTWAWVAIGVGAALIIAAIVLAIYAFGGAGTPQSDDQQSSSTIKVPASGKELSTLREECAAGNMMSCDQLYFEAPVGSEEEAFGNTCGERQQPGKYCHLSALDTEQSSPTQSEGEEESIPQS